MSDRETILQAVRGALKASTLALTDAQVIPTGDPGPRPPIPYLTAKVARHNEPVAGAGGAWHTYSPTGERTRRQNVTASIDLVGFGRGALDWLEGLDDLMLNDEAARAVLDAAGVGYRQATALVDVSTALDTHIEYRATRSLTVDYQHTGITRDQLDLLVLSLVSTLRSDSSPDITITATVDPSSP
jgi:hypothetical protein